jgi:hypothetical protein
MLSHHSFNETFHRFFPKKTDNPDSFPEEASLPHQNPLYHLIEDLFTESHYEINRNFVSHTFGPARFETWTGTPQQTADFLEALRQLPANLEPNDPQFEESFCSLFPKVGFALNKPVEKMELEGKTVYSSDRGALLISLDHNPSEALRYAMIEQAPDMILCLSKSE